MKDKNLNVKPSIYANIISKIEFFNRTGLTDFRIDDVLCKHFSWDLETKEQKLMYFEQDKALLYPVLLSFCHSDDKQITNGDGSFTGKHKHIVKFLPKGEVLKSLTCDKAYRFRSDGTGWYRVGPHYNASSVKEMVTFIKLMEVDPEIEKYFKKVVQNFIDYCNHITSDVMISKLKSLNNVIQAKKKTIEEKINEITDKYGEFEKPDDYSEVDEITYVHLQNEKKKIFKWNIHHDRPGIFLSLTLLTLHTYSYVSSESFTIEQWAEGVLDVLTDHVEMYFPTDEVLKMEQSDFARVKKLFNNCHNKLFRDKVRSYLSNKDKSYWSKSEKKKIIREVYGLTDIEELYFCPYSKKWVTVENHEGHHLSFRSGDNPDKSPENYFPLHRAYNNYISNDESRNLIIKGQNAVHAFDFMIEYINNEMVRAQVSNVAHYLNYQRSLPALELAKKNLITWLEKQNKKAA